MQDMPASMGRDADGFGKAGRHFHSNRRPLTALDVRPTNAFVRFRREEIEQSISSRFEKQAARRGESLAVRSAHGELTYAALNEAANRLAHALLAQSGSGSEPVAVLLEHGTPIITGILGILKAGRPYVPLDPNYPRTRTSYIIEDSRAGLLVTNAANLDFARELAQGKLPIFNIDDLAPAHSTENPSLRTGPDSIAYILYTSGSTGKPKGVPQPHRVVLHEVMNYTNEAHLCEDDRFLLISSCSFADAMRTLYGALLNGASLHPLDVKREGFAPLAEWLRKEQVTIYRSVPTAFRNFAGVLQADEVFPHVRLVYFAGEPVYKRDIDLCRKHVSQTCIIINGLGTSESLTFRWYFVGKDTPIPDSNVPVGYALEDKDVLLLDDAGNEVPLGETGEVAVRSRFLTPGYLYRPDLTEAKFQPVPDGSGARIYRTGDVGRMGTDGCLTHLGRKDFQVKIRGYRIEAAEVEQALVALGTVKEAVVLAREDCPGDERLVAYIVPEAGCAPTASQLRRTLAEELPDYMIPSVFVVLDALPQTATGKLDRRALPKPSDSRPLLDAAFVAPRTPVETRLTALWSEVLNVSPVGVHDNFLDLGGHSLRATLLMSRVRDMFGVQIPLAVFFQKLTVEGLAQEIVVEMARSVSPKDIDATLL